MKLEVRGMSFAYGQKKVLDGLSFSVEAGEFVSILGPSGCGKSTVLNLLAGLLRPAAGEVLVDGQRVEGAGNGRFAYMPQNDLLFPWKTILQNVCLYGKIHGAEAAAREEALKHMAAFGLAGYEDAYPGDLSGGMRQRAAFLRTALCSAEILLLDEPFGALDVISRGICRIGCFPCAQGSAARRCSSHTTSTKPSTCPTAYSSCAAAPHRSSARWMCACRARRASGSTARARSKGRYTGVSRHRPA